MVSSLLSPAPLTPQGEVRSPQSPAGPAPGDLGGDEAASKPEHMYHAQIKLEEVASALKARRPAGAVPLESRAASLLQGKRTPSILANALSGVASSVVAEILLFPVDTVKLVIQTAGSGDPSNFFTVFARILRERGFRGLYRGLDTHILKESIHSFNYWMWHGLLFRYLTHAEDTSRTPGGHRLLINLLAKQLNWLCTVPFEVVASVNQLSPENPGFVAIASKLYKEGGVPNFYRGLGISMFLAINPAIMNTLITTGLRLAAVIRSKMGMDRISARQHGAGTVGLVTALAKVVSTILTYPLIRAKVLQQTSEELHGRSSLAVCRVVMAAEGFGGLYRGVVAMSYKTVLWNSFMMMIKNLIGPKRMMTPPDTPQGIPPTIFSMGREPFVDKLAAEKLDEILQHLRIRRGEDKVMTRVEILENKLEVVSSELQEIKGLLYYLIRRPSVSSHGKPDTEMVHVADLAGEPSPLAVPSS